MLNINGNSHCEVTDLKNLGVCQKRKNHVAIEPCQLLSSNKNT